MSNKIIFQINIADSKEQPIRKNQKKQFKRSTFLAFLFVGVLSITTPAIADVLSDFKASASKKGCESIPYSSQRSKCFSIQSDRKNRCSRPIANCKALLIQKKRLIEKIKGAKGELKKLENKKSGFETELKRHKDEGQIKSFEEKISRIEDEIEDQQDKVTDQEREFDDFDSEHDVDEGIDQAKRCLYLRGGLRELFYDALDDVREVENDPEDYLDSDATDDQKNELRGYADRIIDHIESEEERHMKAEEQYEGWLTNCEKVSDVDK